VRRNVCAREREPARFASKQFGNESRARAVPRMVTIDPRRRSDRILATKPAGAAMMRSRDMTVPLGPEALAHADALFDLARRLTRQSADAEELVQETYARAIAGARTFDGANVKAWLFKILRNTFIDLHHRGQPRPLLSELDVIDGAAARPEHLLRDDRELEHLRGLIGEEIEAALAALSAEARLIVLLDVEGFTETEAADILGCAVGTVKSRLSRARALLREQLKDYARE
jgi:RNA polymerase sigma-70 factor, ECF subfamily